MEGYIKVSRKLLDNPLWTEKPFSKGQAWIDLIGLANWKDSRILDGNDMIIIHRGEVARSQTWLSERWGWSRKKVSAFLNLLTKDGAITKNGTAKGTAIVLENYNKYQGEGSTFCTSEEQLRNSTGTHKNNSNKNKKNKANTLERDMRENIKVKDPVILSYEESASIMQSAHEAFKEAIG